MNGRILSVLLLVFTLMPTLGFAQTFSKGTIPKFTTKQLDHPAYGAGKLPVKNGEVYYAEVVTMANVTAAELYERAQYVLDNIFAKYLVRFTLHNDVDRKLKLNGKYSYCYNMGKLQATSYNIVYFDLAIECREGRYRVVIDNVKDFCEGNGVEINPGIECSDARTLKKDGTLKNSFKSKSFERIGVIYGSSDIWSDNPI